MPELACMLVWLSLAKDKSSCNQRLHDHGDVCRNKRYGNQSAFLCSSLSKQWMWE